MADRWRSRFEAMVEGLEDNPHIVVVKASVADAASPDELAEAKASNGGALPKGAEELYAEMNGCTLEWRVAESFDGDARPMRGSVNLLPVTRVFGDWRGAAYAPGAGGEPRHEPVKPFDLFAPEACAAFNLPKGAADSPVYFHYFGEATVNTRHTFEEYLERLLVSRGFWYWIQALSKETSDNPEAEAFLEIAPLLFPDFQASLFQPR